MTTMQKVDAALARFDRKSPREAYFQVCDEMGIHAQHSVTSLLSDAPRDWDKHRIFDCNAFILGPKGCLAVIPLLLCSRSLRRVSLCSCQVTDEFVAQLSETLQDHGSIRSVDISDNPLVTIYSANPVIKLLRANKNIVRFSVEGTHIGANVSNLINDLCDKNHAEVANYYADDYFRMKNIFNYLDGDGSGWVPLRSLVLNAPYPVLQEQLIERIALKRPKKRSDGTISANTFMELVYTNYKTEVEIAKREKESVDVEYQNIIFNWKRLLEAVDAYNEDLKAAEQKKNETGEDNEESTDHEYGEYVKDAVEPHKAPKLPILPPADFHRVRIRQEQLRLSEAKSIISLAARLQVDADAQSLEEAPQQDDKTENPTNDNNTPKVESKLSVVCIRRAYRSVMQPLPPSNRFRFLREYEEDYIPPMMRAGSRLLSISKLSFLNESAHSSGGSFASGASQTETESQEEGAPVRWWALPPSVVRLVKKFFLQQVAKKPKKRQSMLPVSPRTQRDNAMQKADIPVADFLSAEFVTDLETLRPRVLADKFVQYSIPIDVSTITLQEVVNCLNEYYVHTRADTPISVKKIRSMAMPTAHVVEEESAFDEM